MTRTESISLFLKNKTLGDLAELYTPAMECQVNVGQDGGDKIQGEYQGRMWHGWTDGLTTWKSFRIPRNANTTPEYVDREMTFNLGAHAEGIGMTGWDFRALASRWVAFDFDAITGHSDKHSRKMDEVDLSMVIKAATEIPWVTIRRSASGKGLHLYVFLLPMIGTSNHNEHAALARSILGKMSGLTGFPFDTKVDICGQNMWVWHRKMEGTNGLTCIKQGEPLDDVPQNWRDHIKVVTGHRKRNVPTFAAQSKGDSLQELVGQSPRIKLDETHIALIRWLEDTKTGSWWDADNHFLVTHTWHLKKAHQLFGYVGDFDTLATGTEAPTDVNCFMCVLRHGAWAVRRYSMGVQESMCWTQDGRGWTRCYYNQEPDLPTMARVNDGLESPNGGFVFKDAQSAFDVATSLGAVIPALPSGILSQKSTLKEHKDGRLLMEIEGDSAGVADMKGWLHEKGKWRRLFNIPAMAAPPEIDAPSYDETVRHLSGPNGEDEGWVVRDGEAPWREEPLQHIKAALISLNLSAREVVNVIGSSVLKCWKLVNKPFQPEFPGNREWNRDAAQFRWVPSQDRDRLKYPTWQRILAHAGKGLDDSVARSPWSIANGLATGADYLKIWCASLFKEPNQPLPYLFFYSKEQNTGKSTFHEALGLLLSKGYARADQALTSQNGFNGELLSAIICVVEEIDLSHSREALNRMKDWVTAKDVSIHAKNGTPYMVPNTTHWIQCSNNSAACPTFPGDTRITMIHVPTLSPEELIPKKIIIGMLEREAPDFIAAILDVEIPPSNDRLNVPVLTTTEKKQAEEANRNPLECFIADQCVYAPGYMIPVSEFYTKFSMATDPSDLAQWTKVRVSREFPIEFVKGRNPADGQATYGNIAWGTETIEKRNKLRSIDRGKYTVLDF